MDIAPGIIADVNICSGKPVIKGTRIPVEIIIGKLAGGMTYEEVIDEYGITRKDILASLNYAADTLSHEEIKAVR
jgi:uncharacterized protein (DUF433 family)